MPTYDYQCSSCGNVHEEFLSISETPRIKCPKCKSKCKRVLLSGGNFILKGSGWPSKEILMKKQMTDKNTKMKSVMKDRERSGEGRTSLR